MLVVDGKSTWAQGVVARMQHLLSSHSYQDWDLEGALPLELISLSSSLQLLSTFMTDSVASPSIVPTQEGGLSLEWHSATRTLEIAVDPKGRASTYFRNSASGEEWEVPFGEVRDRIRPILEHLSS
jgi:hypothetical protein